MKIIRQTLLAVVTMVALSTSFAAIGEDEIVGGYIDTRGVMMLLLGNDSLLLKQYEAIQLGEGRAESRQGNLYIIQPDGRYASISRQFKDRAGNLIRPPVDSFDKIIYLNRKGVIRGAIGLPKNEMSQFVHGSPSINDLLFDELDLFRDGLKHAADVFVASEDSSEDDQRDIFVATIGMTSGLKAQEVVTSILNAAEESAMLSSSPFEALGVELKSGNSVLKGIDLVEQGGDGDGGDALVEQGGDGDGGDALVSQGGDGDGGDALVAQGGDGDGGDAIVQGWKVKPRTSVAVPYNLNATCKGSAVFLN